MRMSSEAAPRLWYNVEGGRYHGGEPCFYDPAQFPWAQTLEENWPVIKEEILSLLERRRDRLKPYFIERLVFPPRRWKTLGFYFWKYRIHENCRDCPETMRILHSIPRMTACSLSILEPGSNINPHQGDTNAIIRVHLGLTVPSPLPDCGFQVGGEVRAWEEGKALLFCDAHTHTAWNRSEQRRLILIVDVMREEFARQEDAICSHVLASTALQVATQRFGWLRKMPGSVQQALHPFIRLGIRAYLPLQRRAGSAFRIARLPSRYW